MRAAVAASANQQLSLSTSSRTRAVQPQQLVPTAGRPRALGSGRQHWRCRAEREEAASSSTDAAPEGGAGEPTVNLDIDKEVSKFARNAASTFAPRASGAVKNPAFKGSTLYTVFEVQAWLGLAVGGLLSFNIIFPSDKPDIARLLGMWSIWMFTVPALRARECTPTEKDALNLLFLAIPLLNVALPFVWKSFPFIFTADCVLLASVFAWKGLIPGVGPEQQEQQE